MSSPDQPCPHENFTANVAVHRLTASDTDPTVVGYYADITMQCAGCEEPFRWTGLQAGLSQARPMCSVDETELHAPLRPASTDPDFGMSLPGYAVTWRGGPAPEQPAHEAARQMDADPHGLKAGMIVKPYTDHGQRKWVFRCWGTDTCDGALSLDHYSEQSAQRARDRHVATEHPEAQHEEASGV